MGVFGFSVAQGPEKSKQGVLTLQILWKRSNSLFACAVSKPSDRSVISSDRNRGKHKSHLSVVSITDCHHFCSLPEMQSYSGSFSLTFFFRWGEDSQVVLRVPGASKQYLANQLPQVQGWSTSWAWQSLGVEVGGGARGWHQVVCGASRAVPGDAGEEGHAVPGPWGALWGLYWGPVHTRTCPGPWSTSPGPSFSLLIP